MHDYLFNPIEWRFRRLFQSLFETEQEREERAEFERKYDQLVQYNSLRIEMLRKRMGAKLCTHPQYVPQPHHAHTYRNSFILKPGMAAAQEAGRI